MIPPGGNGGGSTVDRLVSVFLTPDEHVRGFDKVEASDRRARYDGVIQYGSKLLVVVESKLFSGVNYKQAQNINPKGVSWGHSRPVAVKWHELLNRWWDLQESPDLGPTESEIMSDFFDYAETNFGDLLPFTDLGRCKDNQPRRLRRLRSIMQDATGMPAEIYAGGVNPQTGQIYPPGVNVRFPDTDVTAVDRVGMWIDGGDVHLAMWPAELARQYKYLFTHPERVKSLVALTDQPGWGLHGNFRIAYRFARPSQRWYPTRHLSGADYVHQWIHDVGQHAGGRSRDELEQQSFRHWLLNRHYAVKQDLDALDVWLSTRPGGIQFHIRPGVQVERKWTLAQAIKLDQTGQLGHEARQAIDQMLAALDEPALDALSKHSRATSQP